MESEDEVIKGLTRFFFEVGSLRKMARAHRQSLLTDDLSDNIAAHSYRVGIIGWFLAQQEGADAGKVLLMSLFHDLGETRSGDQSWIHKRYVKIFENEITAEQFKGLPGEANLNEMAKEYHDRETKEAKVAKDADMLDQFLLLREYEWQGNREAAKWLENIERQGYLFTETAKKICAELLKQDPSEWWENIWTRNRR